MSGYIWLDKKENNSINPRAKKVRKITDEEYLRRLDERDNYKDLYAQGDKKEDE